MICWYLLHLLHSTSKCEWNWLAGVAVRFESSPTRIGSSKSLAALFACAHVTKKGFVASNAMKLKTSEQMQSNKYHILPQQNENPWKSKTWQSSWVIRYRQSESVLLSFEVGVSFLIIHNHTMCCWSSYPKPTKVAVSSGSWVQWLSTYWFPQSCSMPKGSKGVSSCSSSVKCHVEGRW